MEEEGEVEGLQWLWLPETSPPRRVLAGIERERGKAGGRF